MSTVYMEGVHRPDGGYLSADEAMVPVNDRGFLFGDGVYEVTPAYRGRLFRWDQHLERMRRGLAAIGIDFDPGRLRGVKDELLARNALGDVEVAYVYVQVTRGVAPRSHAFPNPPAQPTIYGFANEYRRPSREVWGKGYDAVTVPDQRWARADVKAIALLANVLAQQAAVDARVNDSIFVRDGIALEGSHANLFAVLDGVLTTAPRSNYILHGVTREFVIELARGAGIPVEERAIPLDEFRGADEVFLSGTTTEVRPLVQVDGRPVGDGKVGPVAVALYDAFVKATSG